ncbi:Transcriptional regulatory protein, C terminal [Paenibacillus sp. UNCCL117]|uniref:FHA domain-containing protein n=1 Tax=unclassified Paenibacillus TaxID=185978 RepID=UPI000884B496|nr:MULTISPECIES: FHA domain-containing protein [unclassified Paenibacillus]SDD41445.1 Transcriptional regulatory protein, C terminal [Paenibacillus sp. cl123]SFW47835.1 Transcriptional regulatory protein, C terminal [Paenibacillus sp. UNCCL117]
MEGNVLDTYACLYVIRGEPFRSGTCLDLTADETVIGRATNKDAPDFAFSNAFISRKHVVIRREGEQAVLYDLGSRHGTELNGSMVKPHVGYPLKSFDIVKLAKGMTVLHFSYIFADQTLEFEPLSLTQHLNLQGKELERAGTVALYWEKRECVVGGKRIAMSEKEYLLLHLLHEEADRLVPVEEIKRAVWPERSAGKDGIPDVTMDELNALVYRIRKKYGKDTFAISAVRGSGYILELE